MMKITYQYTTRMTIILDAEFRIEYDEYDVDTLDSGVDKARWAMEKYGFTHADIIDSHTGEVLVIIDND